MVCNYDLETYVRNDKQERSIQKEGSSHFDYCVGFKARLIGESDDLLNSFNKSSPMIQLSGEQASCNFIRLLIDTQRKLKCDIHCYAYNGSKFDAHFIMRAARKMQLKIAIVGSGSDIKEL